MRTLDDNLILQAAYDKQLLIYGHRGAMAYAPMNTLPAFELAAEQGAHGIELDVQLTKDRQPVILHDFTVDATTNGVGSVAQMTLNELKDLDAGSWYSSAFEGAQIPTLDEVFEAVGQKLLINVEIKSVTPHTDGVEQIVADCIARHNVSQRVLISSFNPFALRRFVEIMHNVPIGFLYASDVPADTQDLMQEIPYQAYHPHHEMIDSNLIAEAQKVGHVVNAWTVNEVDEARRLKMLGVHGIITNKPDILLSALNP